MDYKFQHFENLEAIKKIEENAVATQPYLVAYFMKQVIEVGEGVNSEDVGSIRSGLDAIKLAFYHLTKTYGLVALSYFIDDEEFMEGSEPLADYVSRMRMLFDSTCKDFLLLYYKVYKKNNRESKLHGIMEAIGALTATENSILVNEKGHEKKTDAMSAAISIRNSILGHMNREMDGQVLLDYYWQYRECLAITAKHLNFIDGKTQAICYCNDFDEFFPEESEVAFLHGSVKSFGRKTDILTDEVAPVLADSQLFHWQRNGQVLPLEPFFSFLDYGLDGEIDGEKDEYLAYEALGRDQAIFEGIRSRINHPNHYVKIKQLFQEKGIELVLDIKKYNFKMLSGFSLEASNRVYLRDYLNKKYDPELYVERHKMKEELDYFFKSDAPAFVFTGTAGVGKSVLLAHYVEGFIERKIARHGEGEGNESPIEEALFFINASRMTNQENTLFNKLLEGLCLKGELPNLQSFLDSVDKMIKKQSERCRVTFVIDAVNEAQQSVALWQEIQEIVGMTMSTKGRILYPWLKIIIAIRDTGITQIENKMKASAGTVSEQKLTSFILRPELFFQGLPESDNKEIIRRLSKFTGKELEALLTKYLGESAPEYNSKLGGILSNPLCLSIYQSLPMHKRETLVDEGDILGCWMDWLEERPKDECELDFQTIKRRQLISFFSEETLKTGDSIIDANDVVDFTAEEKGQAQNMGVTLFAPTVEQLVLEGLLIESGLTYQIKNQLLRGLCLARYFEPDYEKNSLSAKAIVDLALLYGEKITDFSDAFVFLIKKRIDHMAYEEIGSIWCDFVERVGVSDSHEDEEYVGEKELFINLWEGVIRKIFIASEHKNRQGVVENIIGTGVGLVAFSEVCQSIAYDEGHIHFEQAIELCEMAIGVRKNLYEVNTQRIDLADYYTEACNNLAYLIINLGGENINRGIELYDISLRISKELYEAYEGRIDLALNYTIKCNNLALVLKNMGEDGIKRALELFEVSLKIRKKLYEADKENIDLAQKYVVICGNLARLLDHMGEETKRAIGLYEIALKIAKKLYEAHEGRIDLADDYGMTCNNLAKALSNMGDGDRQRAIELYEIDLRISKELYEGNEGRIDLAKGYAMTCTNFAGILENMGEVERQRGTELYEIALKIGKELYENYEGRIDLAKEYTITCNAYALVLKKRGEEGVQRAIKLYEIDLEISKKLYEANKERIDLAKGYAATCNNYARVMMDTGEEGESRGIELYEIALRTRKELYEGNKGSINLARSYTANCNNLARILENRGGEGIQRAMTLYEIDLEISKKLYEANKERIDLAKEYATTCNNYAGFLMDIGEEGKSRGIELYGIALRLRKDIYKANDENIEALLSLAISEVNIITDYLDSRNEAYYSLFSDAKENFIQHVELLNKAIPDNSQVQQIVALADDLQEVLDGADEGDVEDEGATGNEGFIRRVFKRWLK